MTTEVDVSPVPEAAVPDPDAPAAAAAEGVGKGAKSDAPAKGEVKEVPKPDKPRLPKPDRASLESAIAELQEAADEKQARIEQLKRAIETRRDARKNVGAGSQETKSRIAELNSTFSAHMSERNAIRKELIALDAARERLKEQSSAMKSKLKFYTLEAVDKEVARLEETLAHTTMSLNEEKKIVTTIKDLGKSRDAVRQYAEAQAKATGDDGARRAIIERLRAKDAEIDAVKAEQGVVRAALDATRSKEEKAGADIPKMQEERNACYEVIKAKREKIRALRADFKKTQDEYWERERLWRSFLTAEKQKQWEATVEERKAREEARKQWERENAPEPFEAEVTAADQLVAYLARWDPSSREGRDDALEAAKKAEEAREKAAAALSGLTLLGKKNNTEDDDLFSLSGSSSGKKSKLKAKAKAKVKTAEGAFDPSERLHVSFDAYGSFAKLALAAPTTAGEVPATLEALRAKKAEFLEKRRVKKERIAAGLEDEEDGAAKEAASGGRAKGSRGKAGAKGGKGRKTRGKKGKALVDVTIEVVEDAVKVTIEEIGEDVEE